MYTFLVTSSSPWFYSVLNPVTVNAQNKTRHQLTSVKIHPFIFKASKKFVRLGSFFIKEFSWTVKSTEYTIVQKDQTKNIYSAEVNRRTRMQYIVIHLFLLRVPQTLRLAMTHSLRPVTYCIVCTNSLLSLDPYLASHRWHAPAKRKKFSLFRTFIRQDTHSHHCIQECYESSTHYCNLMIKLLPLILH